MTNQVMRVAWYRLRTTLRRRLTEYLGVALIIGLLGGVAMTSVAGARRTQAAYPEFISSTSPSDLTMAVYASQSNGGSGPNLKREIRSLPGIARVVTAYGPNLVPLAPNGAPRLETLSNVVSIGSLDGMFSVQDRLAVTAGRAADPANASDVTLTQGAAQIYDVHVGQTFPLGLYTPAQMALPNFGTPKVRPRVLVQAKVVGLVDINTQVLQDDVDGTYGFVFVTPAFMREILATANAIHKTVSPALYAIQLRADAPPLATMEQRLVTLVPRGYTYEFHVTSRVTSQVQLAIRPESIALGAFGGIAALACFVIAAQAISRLLRRDEEDVWIMQSLGARPIDSVVAGLFGILASVAAGTALAIGLASGLSPLAPIGPVRPVYPHRGFAADWTVFGLGSAILILGLVGFSTALSLRVARRRRASSERDPSPIHSARTALAGVLPVSGTLGMHFALDSGRGRTAVPVRSVLAGTVLAVVMVVATLTFASGLGTLVARPTLYGWNWTYALNPTNDVPPIALSMLNRDHAVAAWSGADYTDVQIDNQEVPILIESLGARVTPPLLAGHGIDKNNQIVLGAATLASLHKHIGDEVTLSLGVPADAPEYLPPRPLTVVGTATFPAVGYSTFVAEHTSMGTGALVSLGAFPKNFTGGNPDPILNGPELVFVRLRPSISPSSGRANLDQITRAANRAFAADPNAVGNGVAVLGVSHPLQIVNYKTVGATPIVLAIGLAAGAIVALGLTLASSVRRRRRDLALLKTLGFTRRQVGAAIVWQASIIAAIGAAIGIPLGIVAGRELWTLFAQSIDAVPDPTVPTLSILAVGAGALIFANLVATLPGRVAAKTLIGHVLRAE